MMRETMSCDERVQAAISLEKPDRVPIVPTLLPEPAARLAGLTQAQVSGDSGAALDAIVRVYDEYGGWDNVYPGPYKPVQLQAANLYPMKMRLPGKDLPDDHEFQLVEEEILRPDDYDRICEKGIDVFYYEDFLGRISDMHPHDVPELIDDLRETYTKFLAECEKRGRQLFFGTYAIHPFFTLSLMRSMVPFTQDLYFNPEPVQRALKRMTDELIEKQIHIIKASGINRCLLVEERASGFFYPPAVFERFWWPYTMEIVDAFWSEGITTIFHLDTCWDRNIHYFKKLPRGSAILELDSMTDIFRAKEIVRGHLCIHGDVSAALLSIGKPADVEAYCKRLIDEVGGDGGFILGSGCSVPNEVRPENFRAMIETGKTYGL